MIKIVQKFSVKGIKGTGIVAVLIIAGFLLVATGVTPELGKIAIGSGVTIAILLGLLGIFGVAKRVIG